MDVVLKRFSRSVIMEEDTLGYGGGDSGIEMINEELVFSHFVLTRQPDLVCQKVIKCMHALLRGKLVPRCSTNIYLDLQASATCL